MLDVAPSHTSSPTDTIMSEVLRHHSGATTPTYDQADEPIVKQELRFHGDLYTPEFVRKKGPEKEGYCNLCEGKWLQLKNSAYWYHKQFTHGISSVTGRPFVAPVELRTVCELTVGDQLRELPSVTYSLRIITEAFCHECNAFVPLATYPRKRIHPISLTPAAIESIRLECNERQLLFSHDARVILFKLDVDPVKNRFILPKAMATSPQSILEDHLKLLKTGAKCIAWWKHAARCHRALILSPEVVNGEDFTIRGNSPNQQSGEASVVDTPPVGSEKAFGLAQDRASALVYQHASNDKPTLGSGSLQSAQHQNVITFSLPPPQMQPSQSPAWSHSSLLDKPMEHAVLLEKSQPRLAPLNPSAGMQNDKLPSCKLIVEYAQRQMDKMNAAVNGKVDHHDTQGLVFARRSSKQDVNLQIVTDNQVKVRSFIQQRTTPFSGNTPGFTSTSASVSSTPLAYAQPFTPSSFNMHALPASPQNIMSPNMDKMPRLYQAARPRHQPY